MKGYITLTTLFLLVLLAKADAQIVQYECNSYPEEGGWYHIPRVCPAERWLANGWLFQHAEPTPEPCQEADAYRRSLKDFTNVRRFFCEWVVETDGPRSEIVEVAPASFVAGGQRGIHYHFTIARDQVRFLHDAPFPTVFVDISPNKPHEFRLDVYGAYWFEWAIDGKTRAAGVPPKTYPTADSFIVWGNRSAQHPNTTRWDYIYYGVPEEPPVECDRIRKLKASCRNGRIKAKVKSSLDEGAELTVTNDGVHETLTTGETGNGKVKYRRQTGEHTILLLDCPHISQVVDCGV